MGFPKVYLLIIQPRVEAKIIQVLPETHPHKDLDDPLNVRKPLHFDVL